MNKTHTISCDIDGTILHNKGSLSHEIQDE
jgi:hydroxymethylpyrimidine pyrophosphatase-like HAD family hydrolase